MSNDTLADLLAGGVTNVSLANDPEAAMLARRRALANQLARDSRRPQIRSVTEGLAHVADQLAQGYESGRLDRQERELIKRRHLEGQDQQAQANAFLARVLGGEAPAAPASGAAPMAAPASGRDLSQPIPGEPAAWREAPGTDAPAPRPAGAGVTPNVPPPEQAYGRNLPLLAARDAGEPRQPPPGFPAGAAPPPAAQPSQPAQIDPMRIFMAAQMAAASGNPRMQAMGGNLSQLGSVLVNQQRYNEDRNLRREDMELRRSDRAAADARAAQQLEMDRERLRIQREADARAAQRDREGAVPPGYRRTEAGLERIPGGPAENRPVPAHIQRAEDEDLTAIGTAGGIDQRLATFDGQIARGELNLGLAANAISAGRNFIGASDANSRNYASFRAGLESLRNDSLRLNNGVQTEGDAQRAWNELISNINDPEVVRQRLREIREINQRAIALRGQMINQRRANAQLPPLDSAQFAMPQAAPAQGQPAGAAEQPVQRPPLSSFGR